MLLVHHTPSPALQELLAAAIEGVRAAGAEPLPRPALTASAVEVLRADAVLLGTPVNIGYMSGALKHFFDTVYYPVLTATAGLPYGLYVHGNDSTAGAVRAVDSIAGGLRWRPVRPPVEVVGRPRQPDLEQVADLAALVALAALER